MRRAGAGTCHNRDNPASIGVIAKCRRRVTSIRKFQEVPTSVWSGHSSSPLDWPWSSAQRRKSPPGASAKAPGRPVPRPDALFLCAVVGRWRQLTKRPALVHRPSHSLSIRNSIHGGNHYGCPTFWVWHAKLLRWGWLSTIVRSSRYSRWKNIARLACLAGIAESRR
jgi:hypothetical protein